MFIRNRISGGLPKIFFAALLATTVSLNAMDGQGQLKKYSGKYVALDYGNKEFFIGETASNALSSAKVKNPDRLYYVKLIGAKSAFTIQSLFKGSLQRYKICT